MAEKEVKAVKADRLLKIYSRLADGAVLGKKELAQRFHVSERTVLRDIESLQCFLAEQGLRQEISHDREKKGYYLKNRPDESLNNSEILAVCKILLDSRSMRQEEMFPLLDKLVESCVPPENKKAVKNLISNEKYHYIEPHHGQYILSGLWEIGRAIQEHRVMEIQYERMKEPKLVVRKVEPVGIMFSEYYFYLTAFLRDVDRKTSFENPDDLFPTIYRIDRIRFFKILEERFQIPYRERFEEGEFRKRIQFMYGGKLERIRFRYTGPSIEAVLDRLPTAKIVHQEEDGWTVEAEIFGKGIEMWLRSQGDYVRVLPLESMSQQGAEKRQI